MLFLCCLIVATNSDVSSFKSSFLARLRQSKAAIWGQRGVTFLATPATLMSGSTLHAAHGGQVLDFNPLNQLTTSGPGEDFNQVIGVGAPVLGVLKGWQDRERQFKGQKYIPGLKWWVAGTALIAAAASGLKVSQGIMSPDEAIKWAKPPIKFAVGMFLGDFVGSFEKLPKKPERGVEVKPAALRSLGKKAAKRGRNK